MALSMSEFWEWFWRRRWTAAAFIIAGVGLQAFVELAENLQANELLGIDLKVFAFLHPYHTPFLDAVAWGLSIVLACPFVLLLLAPFLTILLLTRKYTLAAGLVIIPAISSLIVDLLKWLFARPRPLTSLIHEIGNSFPSGHATTAIVFYGMLGYIACRCWVSSPLIKTLVIAIAVLLIIATGMARVYLQVHYFSDVLAGWAAGASILFGSIIIIERLQKHLEVIAVN